MIVAGKTNNIYTKATTSEIVDMEDPTRVCKSPVTYPNPVGAAIGGLVNSVPMVCGGTSYGTIYEKSCYQFDAKNYIWNYSHDMGQDRTLSASANFCGFLWVTGGDNKGSSNSTELVNLSGSIPGPELPSWYR